MGMHCMADSLPGLGAVYRSLFPRASGRPHVHRLSYPHLIVFQLLNTFLPSVSYNERFF